MNEMCSKKYYNINLIVAHGVIHHLRLCDTINGPVAEPRVSCPFLPITGPTTHGRYRMQKRSGAFRNIAADRATRWRPKKHVESLLRLRLAVQNGSAAYHDMQQGTVHNDCR